MKIVQIDQVADVLIAEKVNTFYGNLIVKLLNDRFSGRVSSAYYVLKEDDYQLEGCAERG